MWHKFLLFLTRQYLRRQVRRRPPRPLSELKADRVKRVLLINSTALGDLLFSTPAIRALKDQFPAWNLDILVHSGLKALVEPDPHLSHWWSFTGRNLGLLSLARDLQTRHYDLVIILHGNDPEASLLAWLTGSPFIIGSARSPFSFTYSHSVTSGGPCEHAIERRLNFVRPLGVEVHDKRMEIFLPAAAREETAHILTRHFGSPPARLVAFHPGGSASYKRWPVENFATLGKFLKQAYQAQFLIISSKNERSLADTLAEQINAPALVTGGQYNLLMVAALLSQSYLFVGNDSGPLHLALALHIPSIGLLGADDPHRIGPYQVDWGAWVFKEEACRRNPCLTKSCPRSLCLEDIGPEEVIRLIRDWWEPKYLPDLKEGRIYASKSI